MIPLNNVSNFFIVFYLYPTKLFFTSSQTEVLLVKFLLPEHDDIEVIKINAIIANSAVIRAALICLLINLNIKKLNNKS